MLGKMVAVEAGAVVRLDELQPLLEMPGQRLPAVVQMIEDPKTHIPLPIFRHIADCRQSLRSEAISHPLGPHDRDCFVAALLAMTSLIFTQPTASHQRSSRRSSGSENLCWRRALSE